MISFVVPDLTKALDLNCRQVLPITLCYFFIWAVLQTICSKKEDILIGEKSLHIYDAVVYVQKRVRNPDLIYLIQTSMFDISCH